MPTMNLLRQATDQIFLEHVAERAELHQKADKELLSIYRIEHLIMTSTEFEIIKSKMVDRISNLYNDAITSILQYLPVNELARMRTINKHFQIVANNPIAWKYRNINISFDNEREIPKLNTIINCTQLTIDKYLYFPTNESELVVESWMQNIIDNKFGNLTSLSLTLDIITTDFLHSMTINAKKLKKLEFHSYRCHEEKDEGDEAFRDAFCHLLMNGNLTHLNFGENIFPALINSIIKGIAHSKIEILEFNPIHIIEDQDRYNKYDPYRGQYNLEYLLAEIGQMKTLRQLNCLNNKYEPMPIICSNNYITSLITNNPFEFVCDGFNNLKELVITNTDRYREFSDKDNHIFENLDLCRYSKSFLDWLSKSKLEKLTLPFGKKNLKLSIDKYVNNEGLRNYIDKHIQGFAELLKLCSVHEYIKEITTYTKIHNFIQFAKSTTDLIGTCKSLEVLHFINYDMYNDHNTDYLDNWKTNFKILEYNMNMIINIKHKYTDWISEMEINEKYFWNNGNPQ
jgi:hypothetical protein